MSSQLESILKEIKIDSVNLLLDSENIFKSNENVQNQKIKEITEKFNLILSQIQEKQEKIEKISKKMYFQKENIEESEGNVDVDDDDEFVLDLSHSDLMYLKGSIEKENLLMSHDISEFEKKYEMIMKKEKLNINENVC